MKYKISIFLITFLILLSVIPTHAQEDESNYEQLHQDALDSVYREDYEAAIRFSQQAIDEDPNRIDAYYTLWISYEYSDSIEQSSSVCADMEERFPMAIETLNACGRSRLNEQSYELAIMYFEEAIQLDSNEIDAYIGLITALLENDQNSVALDIANQAINIAPSNHAPYLALSTTLYTFDQPEASLEAADRAIELLPPFEEIDLILLTREQYAIYFSWRGVINMNELVFESAISDFHSSLEYFPDDVDTRESLAFCLTQDGQYEEAIQVFEELIAEDDSTAEYFGELGRLYFRTQQYDRAVEAFEGSLALGLEMPFIYAQLSNSLSSLNRYSEAILVLNQGLERFPDDPLILISRAGVYIEQGNLGAAEIDLRRILENTTGDTPPEILQLAETILEQFME